MGQPRRIRLAELNAKTITFQFPNEIKDKTGTLDGYYENNVIAIRKDLKDQAALDTIIHECLHCCYPSIRESGIAAGAREIADILYRMGVRWTQ